MFDINNLFKNNPELKKHLYILAVVLVSIAFYRYTENMRIDNFIPVVFGVLAPFIYGAILAYILNAPTRFIEKNLKKIPVFEKSTEKVKMLSIVIALLLLLGIIIGIVAYIIPELTSSIQNIVAFLLKFDADTIDELLHSTAKHLNLTFTDETYKAVAKSVNSFIDTLMDSLKNFPDIFGSVITQAKNIASSIYTIIMSTIISVYMLLDREKLGILVGKIMYCFFSRRKSLGIMSLAVHCNEVFESFFVGKLIDSIIIAIIFFLGALILNLPYPLFFSLIIGITNMIPYFGPFIGGIPVVFLTLLYNPIKGLWVLLFIIVLQQFDGVILGPKILGDSIGVKPLGVIFAIVVGGAIAGPLGMFFGVPIFSVISEIVMETIEKNYNEKAITKNNDGYRSKSHTKRNRHNNSPSGDKKSPPQQIVLSLDIPSVKMPRVIFGKKQPQKAQKPNGANGKNNGYHHVKKQNNNTKEGANSGHTKKIQ